MCLCLLFLCVCVRVCLYVFVGVMCVCVWFLSCVCLCVGASVCGVFVSECLFCMSVRLWLFPDVCLCLHPSFVHLWLSKFLSCFFPAPSFIYIFISFLFLQHLLFSLYFQSARDAPRCGAQFGRPPRPIFPSIRNSWKIQQNRHQILMFVSSCIGWCEKIGNMSRNAIFSKNIAGLYFGVQKGISTISVDDSKDSSLRERKDFLGHCGCRVVKETNSNGRLSDHMYVANGLFNAEANPNWNSLKVFRF